MEILYYLLIISITISIVFSLRVKEKEYKTVVQNDEIKFEFKDIIAERIDYTDMKVEYVFESEDVVECRFTKK